MKVLTIVGARPQFVKAAVVSHALRACPGVQEVLVHTGQHYDAGMSQVFFDEMGIPAPDYHLGIGSGIHGAQTGRMLEAIEGVLLAEQPEWVLVYGDTNSTLAGALAAAKLHIPIAHVEAGLRSFNRRMPEEINRVLTDHLSTRLFAPTQTAVTNLSQEGITGESVSLVGDVMYDAALHYAARAEERSRVLQTLGLSANGYLLATIHRAENTDESLRLRAIVEGLCAVADRVPVVMPVHPRTRGVLERERLWQTVAARLRLVEPLGYLDMVMLEKNARLIATDSGGVQKEAFFHRVPCVTLRDQTEWVELVALGWNRLCPPLPGADIAGCILGALDTRGTECDPYGNGRAAEKVADALLQAAI